MADGVWKGVQVFWRSHQLLLNKSYDPISPFMRKVDNGKNKKEKEKKEKENNVVYSGH